jgi:hypothetical protein
VDLKFYYVRKKGIEQEEKKKLSAFSHQPTA